MRRTTEEQNGLCRSMIGALLISTPVFVSATVTSFDISAYPGINKWNALGIAVDPANSNVWVSALAYGGEDNLYRFSAGGTLLNSFRVDYPSGASYQNGSPLDLEIGSNSTLFSRFAYNPPTVGAYAEELVTIDSATGAVLSQSGRIEFLSGDNGPPAGFARVGQLNNSPGVFVALTSLDNQLTSFDASGTILRADEFRDPWTSGRGYDATSGLAFSADNSVLYALYIRRSPSGTRSILTGFSQDSTGTWSPSGAYDIGEVAEMPLAFDFDAEHQRFYVQDNNQRITTFELSDLQTIPVIAEPMTPVLLTIGLVSIGLVSRHSHGRERECTVENHRRQ